tara:strand:- start:7719 stop:7892 length:174 start_codon:yes stop_codon:yes gene_type:complete
MNITSVQYYVDLNGNNAGIRMVENGVTRFVPISTDNTDYAEIMRQVAAGTLTIEEAD